MDEFEAQLDAKLEKSLEKWKDNDEVKKLLRRLCEAIKDRHRIEKERERLEKELAKLPPDIREEIVEMLTIEREEDIEKMKEDPDHIVT